MCDQYQAYDTVLDARHYPGRTAAGCLAHARRKFDELFKAKASAMAEEALLRAVMRLYPLEGDKRKAWEANNEPSAPSHSVPFMRLDYPLGDPPS